jgi:opacity protein-like surface antigen
MKIIKLVAAAALALSGLAMTAAPAAAAQRGDRWEQRANGNHYGRGDRRGGRSNFRGNRGNRDGWRGGRNGRNGWRGSRGRGYGWRGNRYNSCRTIWRHHHRQRVCGWRYR